MTKEQIEAAIDWLVRNADTARDHGDESLAQAIEQKIERLVEQLISVDASPERAIV